MTESLTPSVAFPASILGFNKSLEMVSHAEPSGRLKLSKMNV
jgi:hypothetical protein